MKPRKQRRTQQKITFAVPLLSPLSSCFRCFAADWGEGRRNLYSCHNVFRHFKVREKFNFLLLVKQTLPRLHSNRDWMSDCRPRATAPLQEGLFTLLLAFRLYNRTVSLAVAAALIHQFKTEGFLQKQIAAILSEQTSMDGKQLQKN